MANVDEEMPVCPRCGAYPIDPDQPVPTRLLALFGPGICYACSVELAAIVEQLVDKRGASNDLP